MPDRRSAARPRSRCVRGAPALLGLLALAGCAGAGMPVPESMAPVEAWRVEVGSWWRPDGGLRFGPYEVHQVDRGSARQRGSLVDALLRGKQEFHQRYGYRVRDAGRGGEGWTGRCDSRDMERGYDVAGVEIELQAATSLTCTLAPADDRGGPWMLSLALRGGGAPGGQLTRGEERYRLEVEEHSDLAPGEYRPAGYLVLREDRAVAVLDQSGRESVRLAPDLDPAERDLLAAALAALLLHQQLLAD